jgi:anti-anti-sigma factor
MASAILCGNDVLAVKASKPTAWVRGNDGELLARLLPLVREQSVLLDFSAVERIDAAGVSALIALYREARQAGHNFAVTRPTPRVAEILAVLGLDCVLLAEACDERRPRFMPRLARSAA